MHIAQYILALIILASLPVHAANYCRSAYAEPSETLVSIPAHELERIDLAYFQGVYLDPSQVAAANAKKINELELRAINFYTSKNGYSLINSQLRGKVLPANYKYMPRKDAKLIAQLIESGLNKLKPFVGEVRRGARLPRRVLKHFTPGALIRHNGFTSATKRKQIPEHFVGAQDFTLISKTGKSIENLSGEWAEKEVLFSPGTVFRVLSVEKRGYTLDIRMEEVTNPPPGEKIIEL